MERTCKTSTCDNTIPQQQGRARPREYCTTCRPPKNKPNPRVINLPKTETPPSEPLRADTPLVEAYRKRLEAAERLDSPEGALVMTLARLFAAGEHTSSGAASLSRELRAAMDVALQGAPTEADSLDELARRRQAKAAGA